MQQYSIPMGDLDYKKIPIRIKASSPTEHFRLKSVEKEPKTVEWIETFAPEDIFFDVGANVGAYSLIAATKLNGKGKVYAFEPAAPSFDSLITNTIANKLMTRIVALPIAFGEKEEISFVGLRSLEPGAATHNTGASEFPQPFLVLPMDLFIERYKIPCPTKIKIDVDGAEVGVIRGMQATLKNPTLKEVLIEVRDDVVKERFYIENVLKGAGFTLKAKHPLMSSVSDNVWNRLYVR